MEPCAFELKYSKPFNTVFSKFRMNNKPLVASYQANQNGASKFKLLCDSHHFLCEITCLTTSLSLSLHSKAEVDCDYPLIGKVSCKDDKATYKGVLKLVCTVISRSGPAGWMTGKDHHHVEWYQDQIVEKVDKVVHWVGSLNGGAFGDVEMIETTTWVTRWCIKPVVDPSICLFFG